MKKVFLYSGGFDSTLQASLLKPDILLYMDIGSSYSDVEKYHLHQRYFEYCTHDGEYELPNGSALIIDEQLSLEGIEKDNYIIPFRNAFFVFHALLYGQDIYLGFNESDIAPDKDEEFISRLTNLVTYMTGEDKNMDVLPSTWEGTDFKVSAPFAKFTKAELVKQVLESDSMTVEEVQNIRSCYDEHSIKGCGTCSPCVSKATALFINGIPYEHLFDVDVFPALEELFNEYHDKFRKDTRTYKEYEKFLASRK